MYKLEYNGKFINTKHYLDISDELFLDLQRKYYTKPDFSLVEKELKNLANGGLKIANIKKYFLRDIMAKVVLDNCKWSAEDVFNSKELLGVFLSKISTNKKVFPDSKDTIFNIERCMRLGGCPIARLPGNFPMKQALYFIKKYNINGNYYDFSCGWGVRLLSSLINEINYYGTDPNYLLCDRLNSIGTEYNRINNKNTDFKIYAQGSENFIPELENKIGLAFSSPPYFKLEMYNVGNQSCNQNTEYKDWLQYYIYPTVKNIYKYLIDDGYFLININNYKKYQLLQHTYYIITHSGFKYIGYENLDQTSQRVNMKGGFYDNAEKVMIFKKDI